MSTSLNPAVDACIRSELKKRGHEIVSVDYTPGSSKGDNYLGVITKATIKTKTGENINWIVKTSSVEKETRNLLHIREVFMREFDVYEKLFPTFEFLQEEAGIQDFFKSYPKFITSSKGIPECVVMEDMKSQGFIMKDRKISLEYEFVKIVMEDYGRWHGVSFALREKHPDIYAAFADEFKETFFDSVDTEMWDKTLKVMYEKVLEILPEGEIHDKFENIMGVLFKRAVECLKPGAAGEHAVFGHGDNWLNNILFKCEDRLKPTQVCFLDFQLSRLGSPALDLSYFLFTCTDKAMRDAHWDDFICIYHESLAKTLKSFNLNADQLFPHEVLLEHIRKFSLYGLMMAISVAKMMVSDPDEVPDMDKISKAASENGNISFEDYTVTIKQNHVYNERIQGVIEDCVRLGIL